MASSSDALQQTRVAQAGTVTFNVGGVMFDVMEQTIRAKGETLLSSLLDDPGRVKDEQQAAPIFIEADPICFRYILQWYRYGSICLPVTISMADMRRECAYYSLPDDVRISREAVAEVLAEGIAGLQAQRETARAHLREAQAACVETCRNAVAAKVWHDLITQFEDNPTQPSTVTLPMTPYECTWYEKEEDFGAVLKRVKLLAKEQKWEVSSQVPVMSHQTALPSTAPAQGGTGSPRAPSNNKKAIHSSQAN
eukprot:CAMPEP_0178425688 /NCGR_PEP_ID=MMETSP0689_2-20121128/28850_1 /TAXON_ID=160604 /ORGANISM="Amphidinium massartii, Strain CS-259" /LENGTH=251 /DNA_ID=CAMNT_0020047355 /DNA_START=195 /DNA_END=947 /DNA_ORIENTATION=+